MAAIGILNILFGLLAMTVWIMVFLDVNGVVDILAAEQDKDAVLITSPVMRNIYGTICFFFALLLVASGIGLLRMESWSRPLTLAWATFMIIISIFRVADGESTILHCIEAMIYPVLLFVLMTKRSWIETFIPKINDSEVARG
ncbi:MAG: hypothetical protein CMJ32_06250 [Phycisphaerae bacterium]|nr:hypothetical protein [Phycisphaerae bacterium]